MSDNMAQQFTQPVFYKFRYTFDGQDNKTISDPSRNGFQYKNLCLLIKGKLDQYSDKITFGLEGYNSRREPTYFHVHFHFSSFANRGAISKTLKRLFQSLNRVCTGVKCFSLKPEAFVNEDKFFNYPLKQYDHDLSNNGLAYKCSKGFSIDEINSMRKTAYNTWLVAVQINQGKQDRNGDTGDTIFSRILSRIEEKLKQQHFQRNMQNVYQEIIDLYLEEDKPINLTTIRGYGLTVATKVGIITSQSLVERLLIMQ